MLRTDSLSLMKNSEEKDIEKQPTVLVALRYKTRWEKKATSLRWKRVVEQLRYTIARSPLLNIPFVSSIFRIKAVCYKRPLRSQLVKTP